MWTGWVGNDGKGGGPVLNNAEGRAYGWSTYPEKLQKAGITWKIYQDAGLGLDGPNYYGYTSNPYIGNYGDNSLLYFHQYQNAKPGNPLYDNARTGTDITAKGGLFDQFIADIKANKLPQVFLGSPRPEGLLRTPELDAGFRRLVHGPRFSTR